MAATPATESYAKRLQRHLAAYKIQRLGVRESGVWTRTGRPYPHILPLPLRHLNLIETIRREVVAYLATPAGKAVKLHQYFHHLNSSQAMAFNLFFPFLAPSDADPAPLLEALKLPRGRLETWAFESVPDEGEGTNFDLHLFLAGRAQYFVEVKLSEQEYGTAKRDARHRGKLERVYRGRLAGKVDPAALTE